MFKRELGRIRRDVGTQFLVLSIVAFLSVAAMILSGVFFGVNNAAIQEVRQNVSGTPSEGPTGTTGAPGATNATGSTGASGQMGATGASGSSGATGLSGSSGSTGSTGSTGGTGTSGTTGRTGASGATGAPASAAVGTGATGSGGSPGSPGANGASRTAVLGVPQAISQSDGGTVEVDLVGTVTSSRLDMYALAMFPQRTLLTSVDVQGVIGRSWELGALTVKLYYDPREREFATTEPFQYNEITIVSVASLNVFAREVPFTVRETIVEAGVPFLARVEIDKVICEDLRISIVVNGNAV